MADYMDRVLFWVHTGTKAKDFFKMKEEFKTCECECDFCGGTCDLPEGHHDDEELKTLSERFCLAKRIAERYKLRNKNSIYFDIDEVKKFIQQLIQDFAEYHNREALKATILKRAGKKLI